jgi:hypothetical protein
MQCPVCREDFRGRFPSGPDNGQPYATEERMNIVERSSGYWVVDNDGVIDGPFNTIKEAQKYIDKETTVVLNTFTEQDGMYIVEKKDDY